MSWSSGVRSTGRSLRSGWLCTLGQEGQTYGYMEITAIMIVNYLPAAQVVLRIREVLQAKIPEFKHPTLIAKRKI